MKIKLYSLTGDKISDIEIKGLTQKETYKDALTRYLKVFLANQHQGTSSTKTKAEVSGGGRKPHQQKHTGRARAGTIRSPLWVGGGIAHGPKPRNLVFSLPAELKRKAFRTALLQKIEAENISAVDFASLNSPSTKAAKLLVEKVGEGRKTLFIHDKNQAVILSARNLVKSDIQDVSNVNAYDLVKASKVVIEKSAIEKLEARL